MSAAGSVFRITTAGAITCVNLVLWVANGVTVDACAGASRTISRMTCDNGATVTFLPHGARVLTVTTVNAGDWSGTAGHVVKWRSSTPGTRYNIAGPAAGTTVTYMDIADCNKTGGRITATSATNTDSGNNAYSAIAGGGIRFSISVSSIPNGGHVGTPIHIHGKSFLSTQGAGHIDFVRDGHDVVVPVTSWNDTFIGFNIPSLEGESDVRITNDYGETWLLGNFSVGTGEFVQGGMVGPDYLNMTLPQLCRAVARIGFSPLGISGKLALATKGNVGVGQCVAPPNQRPRTDLVTAIIAQGDPVQGDTAAETEMRGWLRDIGNWGANAGYVNPATVGGNGGMRQFLRGNNYILARRYHDLPA
jgi:hypothetical protein